MALTSRFAARSDVGLLRTSNQDSGYAGPHLAVLADGMGGPAGGDVASSVAVAHLAPLDDAHSADDLLDLLRGALADAHEELMEASSADPKLAGLGTTCIAMLRSGSKLAMVHIGDSRAYLLRDGELTQVTTDHTFVQYLVDTGRITKEEAATHPQRNMILRALGDTDGDVELDESLREGRKGDRWLLCSDGLFGVVSDETIRDTLVRIDDPGECAQALVDLSLRAGAPDNVTCVISDLISVEAARSTSNTPQVVGSAAENPRRQSTGSSSNSAAQRAAALTATPDESEQDEAPKKRRPWARILAATLIPLAIILGGAGAAYAWTQTQYYVAPDDGQVTIFRGIPQSIGPFDLSRVEERTDLEVDSLVPVAQDRLSSPITRGSLEEARDVVDNLRGSQAGEEEPDGESPSGESSSGESPSGESASGDSASDESGSNDPAGAGEGTELEEGEPVPGTGFVFGPANGDTEEPS